MCKVEEADGLIDNRKAKGDEGVDGAGDEAV